MEIYKKKYFEIKLEKYRVILNAAVKKRLECKLVGDRFPIGNESAPIQLAQCWFPGLAISNAKI